MSRLQEIADRRAELIFERRDLASQATAIREGVIARLPELVEMAMETLQQKLAKVYLAKDAAEAEAILAGLLQGEKEVSRAYSTVLAEIEFDKVLGERGIRVNLTKLEEVIQKEMELPVSGHPHFLILDQPRELIEEGLRRFTGQREDVSAAELRRLAAEKIKERILQSEYGITGADCIVAENGVLVLAEDEGHVRAVSNLPYRHVAVVGLEEVVASAEDAVTLVQAASVYGSGRITPTYISFIAGPSRTADVEFRMAYGMHGPKEVHVILLDNGRLAIREQGAGALLKCINCGACYESCRELARDQRWSDVTLSPKALALGLAQGKLAVREQNMQMDEFPCPVGLSAEQVADTLPLIYANER
jgi:L-lactate utilization protein LutB